MKRLLTFSLALLGVIELAYFGYVFLYFVTVDDPQVQNTYEMPMLVSALLAFMGAVTLGLSVRFYRHLRREGTTSAPADAPTAPPRADR